jgi:ABC-type thiamin/hydroxymethylpyrimidine transport system permease subunit
MQLASPFPSALPADHRARNAALALAACAVLLLIGLVSRTWFSARGGTVGLLGPGDISWLDVKRAPTELKLFSTIGIVGIVVALGLLAQAAIMLFRRQAQRVMLVPLNAALGVAAFGCFSFFFHLAFGEMSPSLSISYAGLVAMSGIIAASIIIGSMVRPLARTTNR